MRVSRFCGRAAITLRKASSCTCFAQITSYWGVVVVVRLANKSRICYPLRYATMMEIERVDVIGKLLKLGERLSGLAADDQQFVTEMLNEPSRLLTPGRAAALNASRIVGMQIPGEDPPADPLWRNGSVTALRRDLDLVIWRYIPVEVLLTLLDTKTLHFSPLSLQKDKSEGKLPKRAFDETKAQLPQQFFQSDTAIDADTMTTIMVDQRRNDACLSCWYMGEIDDIRMWKE